jgi:hypothetical protein
MEVVATVLKSEEAETNTTCAKEGSREGQCL